MLELPIHLLYNRVKGSVLMISTKGRYAIRFMIDLSTQPQGTSVPLEEIAARQQISKKYLETVVHMLVKAGIVRGASGKGGGYRLLRKPSECTVGEILMITEGTLAAVSCLHCNAEPCPREKGCKTLPMWKKFDALVHDFFYSITIEDLVTGNIDPISTAALTVTEGESI